MEHTVDQDPRYQLLQETFREMMPSVEITQLETYLLFLQVAEETFEDRQAFFNRFSLSEGKMFVLGLLNTSGPLTPTQLAEAAQVTPGTMTGLLAGLEHSGLIRRKDHPTDGRKATITLAPSAPPLLAQVLVERFHHIEALLSSFTSQEQHLLRALLIKLHQLVNTPSS